MRKIFNSFFKALSMVPYIYSQCVRAEEEETFFTDQIETTINKIFLTTIQSEFADLKVFAFDSEVLGKEVASHLDIGLGRQINAKFNDGENNIRVLDSVKGQRVYVIKTFEDKNINDGIMELLLAVSCIKREGAERITAIIPFFPYSLPSVQAKDDINDGIDFFTSFGSDIVKLLEAVGCDEVITLNSFMSSPKGFAQDSCFMNIQASELIIPYLFHKGLTNPVIVGARSNRLHIKSVAQISKSFKLFEHKCGIGFYNNMNYIGDDVRDRDVVLFTNIIRTGRTILAESCDLKKRGAKDIYCFGFHGFCSGEYFQKLINKMPIQELIMTNTIYHSYESKKIQTISVAKLIAEIISIVHEDKSLSVYRGEREMIHYAYLEKIKLLNRQSTDQANPDRMGEL